MTSTGERGLADNALKVGVTRIMRGIQKRTGRRPTLLNMVGRQPEDTPEKMKSGRARFQRFLGDVNTFTTLLVHGTAMVAERSHRGLTGALTESEKGSWWQ